MNNFTPSPITGVAFLIKKEFGIVEMGRGLGIKPKSMIGHVWLNLIRGWCQFVSPYPKKGLKRVLNRLDRFTYPTDQDLTQKDLTKIQEKDKHFFLLLDISHNPTWSEKEEEILDSNIYQMFKNMFNAIFEMYEEGQFQALWKNKTDVIIYNLYSPSKQKYLTDNQIQKSETIDNYIPKYSKKAGKPKFIPNQKVVDKALEHLYEQEDYEGYNGPSSSTFLGKVSKGQTSLEDFF